MDHLPFTPGTIVYLKAGSPPLVVSGMKRSDGLVMVEWFDGPNLKGAAFDEVCLMPESPEMEYLRQQRAGNVRFAATDEMTPVSAEGKLQTVSAMDDRLLQDTVLFREVGSNGRR